MAFIYIFMYGIILRLYLLFIRLFLPNLTGYGARERLLKRHRERRADLAINIIFDVQKIAAGPLRTAVHGADPLTVKLAKTVRVSSTAAATAATTRARTKAKSGKNETFFYSFRFPIRRFIFFFTYNPCEEKSEKI